MQLVTTDRAALDHLMPMHVEVSLTGHIRHMGPTLRKLLPDVELGKDRFLEIFEVRRPRNIANFSTLCENAQLRLRLVPRDEPDLILKGLMVPLPSETGALVNLSLGISVVDAVAKHGLFSNDFAASDATVDMLYLIEAKTVALEESKRLNKRLQGAKVEAEVQAFTDTLTGLGNRRAMDQHLERLKTREGVFGLMHLDLDLFKQVNDTLGHAAGDMVLQHVAQIMLDETRSRDLVARVGGDEFVLIFDGLVDKDVLDSIACRIIARLEIPIEFEGNPCRISASIGTTLSTFYDAPPDMDRILSDADEALYISKKQGRAQHTLFQPGSEMAREAATQH